MPDESLEMNFIDACQNYREVKTEYEKFCQLAKTASLIGSLRFLAPKVSEYLEFYDASWKILNQDFGIIDPQNKLYEEIIKLQKYGTTLEAFREFMKPYCELLDKKKVYFMQNLSTVL